MKITPKWLQKHKWMIRSSKNGVSYNDFKWPECGLWIDCPDWDEEPECGCGFHGETKAHNGSGILYSRLELVEFRGKPIPIDGNKVKVRRARIVAIGNAIPQTAFTLCGYKIAHDGDTISPIKGDRWLILEGDVTVSNQSGGVCWFYDSAKRI